MRPVWTDAPLQAVGLSARRARVYSGALLSSVVLPFRCARDLRRPSRGGTSDCSVERMSALWRPAVAAVAGDVWRGRRSVRMDGCRACAPAEPVWDARPYTQRPPNGGYTRASGHRQGVLYFSASRAAYACESLCRSANVTVGVTAVSNLECFMPSGRREELSFDVRSGARRRCASHGASPSVYSNFTHCTEISHPIYARLYRTEREATAYTWTRNTLDARHASRDVL